ncbi:MAG: hypothetical protein CO013_04705 [Syntrophobacterales bacterium CG_4_8_14_3_um_filter_58_8]|nr:MAG: hypothetical protein AUK26_03410 [Syntrophaceae bacterium CG2_30_58_14]PIV03540.1 MAG: hypothetical protein COS57_10450 [Syntrophobacterales bacterium CG03_land_8_20_14_0_80_58_14]PJC74351.1 MAG: hypothetical protein CO013_04705 [Syntrophobacterales bacterium CG_4_8_14_3_um_filter_58_8]
MDKETLGTQDPDNSIVIKIIAAMLMIIINSYYGNERSFVFQLLGKGAKWQSPNVVMAFLYRASDTSVGTVFIESDS